MAGISELEIELRSRETNGYPVQLRFLPANSDSEESFPVNSPAWANIDPVAFAGRNDGAALGRALFAHQEVRDGLKKALAAAQGNGSTLRIRLFILPGAIELQQLVWESLCDFDGNPLFNGSKVVFSRFLSSSEWRPVGPRAKSELRALVFVSNPANLSQTADPDAYDPDADADKLPKLTPIDLNAELARAAQCLGDMKRTELVSNGTTRASLTNLVMALKDGYDVVYIVCHGALRNGRQPSLFLESDQGGVQEVDGTQLAAQMRQLNPPPRLIVLASCQSAGSEDPTVASGKLSALGPLLADAGVPAVVAMQGKVSMTTAGPFLSTFFTEVRRHGQLDEAMAVARGIVATIKDRTDYWMPVLFTRLRSGCLWYVPGFEGSEDDISSQWADICDNVGSGECIPIFGPDVASHIYGDSSRIASDIAEAENCPFDLRDQQDTAKVAQYLAVRGSAESPRKRFRLAFGSALQSNAKRILGRDVSGMSAAQMLTEIGNKAAADDDKPDQRDPVRIVAALNAKVFITAANDLYLETVLRQTQVPGAPPGTMKDPVTLISNWRDETAQSESGDDPTVAKPILYYAFGSRSDARPNTSWVLTEDDFFDYMIRASRFGMMPTSVGEALGNGSLVFLGFPLDDWKFRVLFRMIYARGGAALLNQFPHFAVQVDPREMSATAAVRLKNYLQLYFHNSKVGIYWGSATDFLRELRRRLDERGAVVEG